MAISKSKKATTPVSRDILKEKQQETVRLAKQADEAVDLVTRTITNLEGINQRISNAIEEIDSYARELENTREAMSQQHKSNTAIISNFSKLLSAEPKE